MTKPDGEGVPGHAAPMEWTLVDDPNDRPGMTPEEIQRFLDRPIDGVGPLRSTSTEEETDGRA